MLTPDSSRLWPKETYAPGGIQKSYDKQYLRDWLSASGWNKKAPEPELPDENGYWLRAQAAYDTEVAESALKNVIMRIKPWSEHITQQSV